MSLTTSAITGRVPMPNNIAPLSGSVTFTLVGYDTQGVNVVPSGASATFNLTDAGELPAGARLWRNTAGLRGTVYLVTVRWREAVNSCGDVNENTLGHVQVQNAASYTVPQLLNAVPPDAQPGQWWSAITQAQYDEMIAAVALVDADRVAAQAAATSAANSAALAAAYATPRFNTRAAAATAAASWANGTVLYVNSRKFVVDTAGPDRLLAIDFSWHGQFHGQVARAEIGGSVKFACYGDSTTDGNGTTGWTANPTDGSGNAIGTSAHNPPNAWPAIFRDTVRAMFGNSSIEVWNAGYGGKDIVTGWAASNFATAVINNPAYGTPDVCFINFGLNDIVRPAFTRNEFIKRVNYLLNLMDYYGIIPVFMTPDPVIENTLRQGGNIVKVSEIYRELAGAYGIDVFDSGQALNDVFSSNGTNALWSFQQPDNLHGGNNWHRVKGSFIAAKTFPKTLFLDESITNVASWSKYANTEDLTYNIFDAVSNRFGASMNVVAGSYTTGQPLISLWAWNVRPNMHAMWFSVDGDGYYYPRPLSGAPRVSYYSFLTGNTITSPSQNAGCSVGASGYRQSEAPMDIGVINCGLNKLQYLAPTDSTSNAVYLGYFSFRDRSRPATSSNIIPNSGGGMAIYDNDPFGRYGQSAGFGVGKTLNLVCDVQMPVGAGFVLFSQRVFGNPDARVDQDRVALILYRGAANVSLYQVSIISGVTTLIGAPLATATYTWKSGKNEFGFEMSCKSTGQTIDVFEPGSTSSIMSVLRPLSGSPIISGGDVGGFFYNHAAGSGGLASAIVYDVQA